ncbi:MAG: hypothetical protein M1832_000953 [Thelocarpon impressellum]|nr:MAG: hypothetical protein M1832_000953 [Thelocarpon impressellum]
MSPPQLFLLPSGASSDARIVSLANPKTSKPCRYYFCPDKGIYEFTRIAAPRSSPRSLLLADGRRGEARAITNAVDDATPLSNTTSPDTFTGYVSKSADLFIATPIDPLFLVLPALKPHSKKADAAKQLFLSADDHLDSLSASSKHYAHILQHVPTRQIFEDRMADVCDSVEAGDERMLRLNECRLLDQLAAKATGLVEAGLPASLEETFVTRALEVPVVGVKRESSSIIAADALPDADDARAEQPALPALPTDSSTASSTFDASVSSKASTSTALSTPDAEPVNAVPDGIPHLMRIRTALNYLLASYVPAHLCDSVNDLLRTSSHFDFEPLDTHLQELASLRRQALASRSLSDFSRKRLAEDDEAAETRAEKKRRKEEEEKRRKAGESRGVRDLKKVDVSGMKKMSAFFGKKT